jgi:predicted transcriptional regulator
MPQTARIDYPGGVHYLIVRRIERKRIFVAARSGVSYWAVTELGTSGAEVARRLGVTQPAVSQAVKRGAMIIEERRLKLKED